MGNEAAARTTVEFSEDELSKTQTNRGQLPASRGRPAIGAERAGDSSRVENGDLPGRASVTLPSAGSAEHGKATSALPTISTSAMLEIEIDHKFPEGHISIWVDGRLTYTHVLAGTDKKRLVVFHRVRGHELHAMQLSAGKHRLRVQITSGRSGGGGAYDQFGIVEGEFRTIRILCCT